MIGSATIIAEHTSPSTASKHQKEKAIDTIASDLEGQMSNRKRLEAGRPIKASWIKALKKCPRAAPTSTSSGKCSCASTRAQAVAEGNQGPTINQVVASVAASYVEKLLAGTCSWMASYFDLDDGTLRCVPADPKLVAETARLHRSAVAPPARCG